MDGGRRKSILNHNLLLPGRMGAPELRRNVGKEAKVEKIFVVKWFVRHNSLCVGWIILNCLFLVLFLIHNICTENVKVLKEK